MFDIKNTSLSCKKNRPPSLSELTPMIFNTGLTHLGSEASISSYKNLLQEHPMNLSKAISYFREFYCCIIKIFNVLYHIANVNVNELITDLKNN